MSKTGEVTRNVKAAGAFPRARQQMRGRGSHKFKEKSTMAAPVGRGIYARSTKLAQPTERPLKVFGFDPSSGRLLGNHMTVSVPYERLAPGPIGAKFAVIDYDGAADSYYTPVDLDDPKILIQDGLQPTESDPRFHQQMVYAVASETLQHFETALGRNIRWRHGIGRLTLFPHAMLQPNAFYSPEAKGILFGYFRASSSHPGRNLPGQTVFTCLSRDIIAHETTHAIVDSIRSFFMEPSNIDVPAFHEAFADLAALFRHFSHTEALLDTLQKTGGQLFEFQLKPEASSADQPSIQAQMSKPNPLVELAQQFGEASGMRAGLRSTLDSRPNSKDIEVKSEPHDRGAILVSAVFDAYFTIYTRRTADLFRIYRAGGGSDKPTDLPGPLAKLLAAEASRTAEEFFTLSARALDYCPPVDVTFGDFLRALITAHFDIDPLDTYSVRDALMEAFRLRGIVPEGATSLSEDALCWPKVDRDSLARVSGLVFGDPNGLTKSEQDINGRVLRDYARDNARDLGFDPAHGPISAPSFHPIFFHRSDGRIDVDMIVELVQSQDNNFSEAAGHGTFPMRNGVTLSIWQSSIAEGKRPDPEIRIAIPKHFSRERRDRQEALYRASGLAGGSDSTRFRINFALLHGAF
jgi:hypothetical protein